MLEIILLTLLRGGAIITLGNIHAQGDGSVHAAGNIYVGDMAAGGREYVLAIMDGAWVITGGTGVGWIS